MIGDTSLLGISSVVAPIVDDGRNIMNVNGCGWVTSFLGNSWLVILGLAVECLVSLPVWPQATPSSLASEGSILTHSSLESDPPSLAGQASTQEGAPKSQLA